jgi:intein/homing endonuclease
MEICPKKEGVIKIQGMKALTHTGTYQDITHAINKGEEEMYEVELENGMKVTCTLAHRFLTNKGWVPLQVIRSSTEDYEIYTYERQP